MTSIQEWRTSHSAAPELGSLARRASFAGHCTRSINDQCSGHALESTGHDERHEEFDNISGRDPTLVNSASVVVFDARSQKMLEELVNSFQSARNFLLKALKSKRGNEIKRRHCAKTELDNANAVAKSVDETGKHIVQIEKLIGLSQQHCEDASHRLLRRGSCSDELAEIDRTLQQLDQEANIALKHSSVKIETRSPGPSGLLAMRSSVKMLQISSSNLEVDDEESDGSSAGKDAVAKRSTPGFAKFQMTNRHVSNCNASYQYSSR